MKDFYDKILLITRHLTLLRNSQEALKLVKTYFKNVNFLRQITIFMSYSHATLACIGAY